ncbi:DUF3180 domain-containing protein [Microbacterium amylolyticum]|uniref:DUF3180 domain-containing protein n=1 Tax=Microbacterium amylolyticum TaxID=936337 RepID=A0ABS4ZGH8_9MICO|nr:DUF3180 domain-containing protein [Microbacterium amylolyticum]MBP2436387.1 hypothetical protein [Microbacterium amylolyticum]
MTRTSPITLIACAIFGVASGFVIDLVLTQRGHATFLPSVMLPILLLVLGVSVFALGLRLRRAVLAPNAPRLNPFRAVRIAVLAKASSMVGAIIGGSALGMVAFLLTRPVTPPLGSMTTVIATAIGGGVLVVLAVIAEHLCTLPKDPDERQPDAEPGAEPEF